MFLCPGEEMFLCVLRWRPKSKQEMSSCVEVRSSILWRADTKSFSNGASFWQRTETSATRLDWNMSGVLESLQWQPQTSQQFMFAIKIPHLQLLILKAQVTRRAIHKTLFVTTQIVVLKSSWTFVCELLSHGFTWDQILIHPRADCIFHNKAMSLFICLCVTNSPKSCANSAQEQSKLIGRGLFCLSKRTSIRGQDFLHAQRQRPTRFSCQGCWFSASHERPSLNNQKKIPSIAPIISIVVSQWSERKPQLLPCRVFRVHVSWCSILNLCNILQLDRAVAISSQIEETKYSRRAVPRFHCAFLLFRRRISTRTRSRTCLTLGTMVRIRIRLKFFLRVFDCSMTSEILLFSSCRDPARQAKDSAPSGALERRYFFERSVGSSSWHQVRWIGA